MKKWKLLLFRELKTFKYFYIKMYIVLSCLFIPPWQKLNILFWYLQGFPGMTMLVCGSYTHVMYFA